MELNTLGLLCLTIAFTLLLYLISFLDDEEEEKTSVKPPSDQDVELLAFLETRQILNEAFLVAQQKLLDELKP